MGTDSLPRGWTRHVRSSVPHAISLAAMALTLARSRMGSRGVRSDIERAEQEIALLREELALKDSRWIRLSPRRRPHYTPVQRMRILQLKALCPSMGKVRIAQTLARAGMHLSASTVGRVLRERSPDPGELEMPIPDAYRRIAARNPGDLWHIDLTVVPTGARLWVPWLPFTLPQRWPFCWWVLVVVDHVSRAVLGLEIYRHAPSSREMKTECISRVPVPLADQSMRWELLLYAVWYNEHRPQQALDGRTPSEVLRRDCGSTLGDLAPSEPVRLRVSYLAGRRHLPIVELQQAA